MNIYNEQIEIGTLISMDFMSRNYMSIKLQDLRIVI